MVLVTTDFVGTGPHSSRKPKASAKEGSEMLRRPPPPECAKISTDEDLALIKDRPEFLAFVAELMKETKP